MIEADLFKEQFGLLRSARPQTEEGAKAYDSLKAYVWDLRRQKLAYIGGYLLLAFLSARSLMQIVPDSWGDAPWVAVSVAFIAGFWAADVAAADRFSRRTGIASEWVHDAEVWLRVRRSDRHKLSN